ncbi:hypothetical protein [Phascolarctobacterium succinatutens]|nr:hypothetical protein [Phascolarctobacterium succinatutens]
MLNEIDDGVLLVRRGNFMTQTIRYMQYVFFAKDAENVSDAK